MIPSLENQKTSVSTSFEEKVTLEPHINQSCLVVYFVTRTEALMDNRNNAPYM
jgi:hypothetical protein